jgi:hypothetical protein
MRNATHTTSGGTSTLKSLITRAPPFGLRLPASFQLGTAGSPFLLDGPPGLSGQQPRAASSRLKPRVVNWHPGPSSRHPRPPPGPGAISPRPDRGAMLQAGLPISRRFSCARSAGYGNLGQDIPPLRWWAAHGRLGWWAQATSHPSGRVQELQETLVPAGPGLLWPGGRPGSGSCAPCRPAPARRHGDACFMLRRISTIYRGGDRTGKVRRLPDAPAFGVADRISTALSKAAAPGLKMAVRFRPGSRRLHKCTPRARPDAICCRGTRDMVAHRPLAPNPPSTSLRTATAISAGTYSRPGSPAIRR